MYLLDVLLLAFKNQYLISFKIIVSETGEGNVKKFKFQWEQK